MTNTAVTTAAGPILAIDLGKYKCVACVDRAASEPMFPTIDTSRADVVRLIARIRPAVVVVEACSLAGWVHDLCEERGVPCRVANTTAEAWKYKHAKRKTDRDDALRLAQFHAVRQLPEVVFPSQATREWRALIAHRQALITQRVAAQNRIRSILVGQGLPAPRGARAWTAQSHCGAGGHGRVIPPERRTSTSLARAPRNKEVTRRLTQDFQSSCGGHNVVRRPSPSWPAGLLARLVRWRPLRQ